MASTVTIYKPFFGYGSNLWDEQMRKRCPENVYSCIAKLDGWKWIISGRGFATIIRSPSDYVWGTVLLLNADDEKRLDDYEGPNYIKSVHKVDPDGTGTRTKPDVLTYIDKNTEEGTPGPEYVGRLKKAMKDGKAKGIPEEYFRKYWGRYFPLEADEAEVGGFGAEA